MNTIINEKAHVTMGYEFGVSTIRLQTNLKGVTFHARHEDIPRQETLRRMYEMHAQGTAFAMMTEARKDTHEVFVKGRKQYRSCGFVPSEISTSLRKLSARGYRIGISCISIRKHIIDDQCIYGITVEFDASSREKVQSEDIITVQEAASNVEKREPKKLDNTQNSDNISINQIPEAIA